MLQINKNQENLTLKIPEVTIVTLFIVIYILGKSGNRTLGSIIYDNLKNEFRSAQKFNVGSTTENDESSTELSKTINTVDLLLYRGEKYKQNRLKLKEELGKTKYDECTFKPKLYTKNHKDNSSSKSNLKKVKHQMNNELAKYINPNVKKINFDKFICSKKLFYAF